MKNILATFLLLAAAALPVRAVIIYDFASPPGGVDFTGGVGSWNNGFDQFTLSTSVLTIGPVSGGNPDNSGYFAFADIPGGNFNATGLTLLSVSARLDSGNAAPGFIINLYDGDGFGLGALTATFSESSFNSVSFTTAAVVVGVHPETGNIANIRYFGIAGTGTGAAFRISLDAVSLNAIPEPGTYAALAGVLALGFAFWRRSAARA